MATATAATAADPEQKRRRTRIAPDVDTFSETDPDVNAFLDPQRNSKRKIITFASDRTTRVTFPDPKAREIKSSGHILAAKVDQNLRPTTFRVPAVAQSCSRRVSAPLSGCPGRCPGAPKTLLFLKERATFPLCAPHRFHAPAGTRPIVRKHPFGTSAPPPLSIVFSTFLPHFVPTTGKPTVSAPDPHAGPLRGRRIDWPAATAADPEQKRRRTRIAPDVATLFETHPDVNAFFETQWDPKPKS